MLITNVPNKQLVTLLLIFFPGMSEVLPANEGEILID